MGVNGEKSNAKGDQHVEKPEGKVKGEEQGKKLIRRNVGGKVRVKESAHLLLFFYASQILVPSLGKPILECGIIQQSYSFDILYR